jgi:hypothetical protein
MVSLCFVHSTDIKICWVWCDGVVGRQRGPLYFWGMVASTAKSHLAFDGSRLSVSTPNSRYGPNLRRVAVPTRKRRAKLSRAKHAYSAPHTLACIDAVARNLDERRSWRSVRGVAGSGSCGWCGTKLRLLARARLSLHPHLMKLRSSPFTWLAAKPTLRYFFF